MKTLNNITFASKIVNGRLQIDDLKINNRNYTENSMKIVKLFVRLKYNIPNNIKLWVYGNTVYKDGNKLQYVCSL